MALSDSGCAHSLRRQRQDSLIHALPRLDVGCCLTDPHPVMDRSAPLAHALELHRVRIEEFLLARCRGWAEAGEIEDALQELWLRIRDIDASQVADPKAYLYRAAHNIMLDRARARASRLRHESDWSYVHGEESRPASAERTLLARERIHAVDGVLRQLGERAALIFRRYRLDGVEQKRIAVELDVSLSTVEKDLRRSYAALMALREVGDDA